MAAERKQFLDSNGLTTLVNKIRTTFGSDIDFTIETNATKHTITIQLLDDKTGAPLKSITKEIAINSTLGKSDIDRIFNLVG